MNKSTVLLMTDEYTCLNITREDFLKIYAGTSVEQYVDLFYTRPQSEEEMFQHYLPSKLWRLNNIYTIVDKYGNRIIFRMNRAQHKVYAASLRHPRLIILKSRQQGISTLWLVSFFDDTVCNQDFSIGLMAQGLDESSTLLERTKILWDELGSDIKQFLRVGMRTNNTKEFSLTNGSNIFVRTSFRSTTLQRLHISEMGKIANKNPEKAKETKTGTLQAIAQGNTVVIESTAEGDNMFKDMWDNSVMYTHALSPKDFFPVFLSWLDDPDCVVEIDQPVNDKQKEYFKDIEAEVGIKLSRQQKNFWIVQYRELGEKIYQEYPTTAVEAFMATKEGAYWARLYFENVKTLNREVDNLYDKNLDVEVSVDLGMDDTNVILPFQCYTDGFRVIGELADNGQRIKYYCDWMKEQEWFDNLTKIILPHDGEVTELTSGKTRTEVFDLELNYDADGRYDEEHIASLVPKREIQIEVLERTSSINEDIEQVRQIMDKLWIDNTAEYIKYCLLNYKKEWDERRDKWRNKPEHDEASNGAAAVRYMVKGATRTNTLRTTNSGQVSKKSTIGSSVHQHSGRQSKGGGYDV